MSINRTHILSQKDAYVQSWENRGSFLFFMPFPENHYSLCFFKSVRSNLLHLLNFNLTYVCPLLLFPPNALLTSSPQQSHITVVDWLFAGEKHELYSNYFKLNDGFPSSKGHWPFPPGRRGVRTVLFAFKNVVHSLAPLFLFYYFSPSLRVVTENSKSTVPIAAISQEYLKVFFLK